MVVYIVPPKVYTSKGAPFKADVIDFDVIGGNQAGQEGDAKLTLNVLSESSNGGLEGLSNVRITIRAPASHPIEAPGMPPLGFGAQVATTSDEIVWTFQQPIPKGQKVQPWAKFTPPPGRDGYLVVSFRVEANEFKPEYDLVLKITFPVVDT